MGWAGGRSTPRAEPWLRSQHDREPGWDSARLPWNRIQDQRPEVVVRARSAADVALAVRYARSSRLRLAVQSSGHGAGESPGALEVAVLLDMSAMRSVAVDAARRRALPADGSAGVIEGEHVVFGVGLAMSPEMAIAVNASLDAIRDALRIVFGLVEGQRFGWGTVTGPVTIPTMMSAGVLLLAVFVAWERRQPEPLMPRRSPPTVWHTRTPLPALSGRPWRCPSCCCAWPRSAACWSGSERRGIPALLSRALTVDFDARWVRWVHDP